MLNIPFVLLQIVCPLQPFEGPSATKVRTFYPFYVHTHNFFESLSNDDLINDKHMSERNEDKPLIVSEIKFHRNNLYMVLSCIF